MPIHDGMYDGSCISALSKCSRASSPLHSSSRRYPFLQLTSGSFGSDASTPSRCARYVRSIRSGSNRIVRFFPIAVIWIVPVVYLSCWNASGCGQHTTIWRHQRDSYIGSEVPLRMSLTSLLKDPAMRHLFRHYLQIPATPHGCKNFGLAVREPPGRRYGLQLSG